jgi:DNA-binding transcriptional ArsR family regulator
VNVQRAIADPVRLDILGLLRDGPELSAGALAGRFVISRPAVSRHLRVLREAGLVRQREAGRERLYSLDREPLVELLRWLSAFLAPEPWAAQLDALETEVARTRNERKKTSKRKDTA